MGSRYSQDFPSNTLFSKFLQHHLFHAFFINTSLFLLFLHFLLLTPSSLLLYHLFSIMHFAMYLFCQLFYSLSSPFIHFLVHFHHHLFIPHFLHHYPFHLYISPLLPSLILSISTYLPIFIFNFLSILIPLTAFLLHVIFFLFSFFFQLLLLLLRLTPAASPLQN